MMKTFMSLIANMGELVSATSKSVELSKEDLEAINVLVCYATSLAKTGTSADRKRILAAAAICLESK